MAEEKNAWYVRPFNHYRAQRAKPWKISRNRGKQVVG
jgi:hypothetical protein